MPMRQLPLTQPTFPASACVLTLHSLKLYLFYFERNFFIPFIEFASQIYLPLSKQTFPRLKLVLSPPIYIYIYISCLNCTPKPYNISLVIISSLFKYQPANGKLLCSLQTQLEILCRGSADREVDGWKDVGAHRTSRNCRRGLAGGRRGEED